MQLKKSLLLLSVIVCAFVSSSAFAAYIDNGDGTVTDTGTGLMWQQASEGGGDWVSELAYCENLTLAGYTDWRLPTIKELASLIDTSRYNPAINITYFPGTSNYNYATSTTAPSYGIGTSSNLYAVWYVDFNNGNISFCDIDWCYGYKTGESHLIRAVRSGQAGAYNNLTLWPVSDTGQTKCYDNAQEIACPQPGQTFYGQDGSYSINPPAYTKLAAGGAALADNATTWAMVRDEITGLVWEQKHAKDSVKNYADPNDADNTYTWYDSNPATNGGNAGTPGDGTDTEDFITALNTSSYGGYSDWRLPSVTELRSLLDYGRSTYPAINTTYFPNTVGTFFSIVYYWSSTTQASDSARAWNLNFYWGKATDLALPDIFKKSNSHAARAVRGGLRELAVSKTGTGAGGITSTDGKINCGSVCSGSYAMGTLVTLHAAASSGSVFTGWSGGCSGTSDCTFTVNENIAVTAGFAPGIDTDGDGISDTVDNCPNNYNPRQLDADNDSIGDVCDATPGCGGCGQGVCEYVDRDNDTINDLFDNCLNVYNPQQLDANSNGTGDCCDPTPGCGGCGQVACDTLCARQ